MWIDTRECVPLEDGFYLIQTVFGEINGYSYTNAGGWNTRYTFDGKLSDKSVIENSYVARWYKAERPAPVPEEWENEHLEKFRG